MGAMEKLLITGGRVVDPASGMDAVGDVLIEGDKIVRVGKGIKADGVERTDAKGLIVAPGLVDLHAHFREPGREDKETVETGSRAAVRGGYTSVCCMPNTEPPLDHTGVIEAVQTQAQRAGLISLYPFGAVSKGLDGKELAELGELKAAGAVGVTDDGKPVQDAHLMRRALEYSRMLGLVVMNHCQDLYLAGHGVMNEGIVSTRLGLEGMPVEAEVVMVARDIELAALTGGQLHVGHISAARSVELVREAKRRGLSVTAEACPHHLALTDEMVSSYDTNMKVNPPLRTRKDVEAVIAGLADGTIDAIATDHAPHTAWEKELEFDQAPFGMIGLETSLGVSVTHLVKPGHLDWPTLIERMSTAPARALGLPAGTLSAGAFADVVLIDPDATWCVDPSEFASKSRNCPFVGMTLTGQVVATIRHGRVVYRHEPARVA